MSARVVIAAVLLIAASVGFSEERVTICAKYRVEYGWSTNYRVTATLMTGNELNRATRTFDYAGFSKYVVIFWDEGEASIIQLDSPYLTAIPVRGEDRRGVIWAVSKAGICF